MWRIQKHYRLRSKSVFEVNSTNFSNESLNELFGIILCPKERGEEQKNLDWVKAEIEKEK